MKKSSKLDVFRLRKVVDNVVIGLPMLNQILPYNSMVDRGTLLAYIYVEIYGNDSIFVQFSEHGLSLPNGAFQL